MAARDGFRIHGIGRTSARGARRMAYRYRIAPNFYGAAIPQWRVTTGR